VSSAEVDVVVVGAGVMGSATAWWLARRGRSVVLVDQFEAGHARGSSHGATRIFRFAYADRRYVRMAMAALPLWRELEDDAGEILLETTGAVDHGDVASIQATATALRAEGALFETLTAEEASERWPHMAFEGPVLHHPDGGRCLADRTVAALQRRAADHGADVLLGQGPVRVDGTVVTGHAKYRARVVVVAAGAWLPAMGLPVELPPMRVTREQVHHFAVRSDSGERPSFIHHRPTWVYGLFGAGEGMKVAFHHRGREVDPDEPAGPRDDEAEREVVEYVERWFPGLDPTPVSGQTCLYTTTPDESFVIERHGNLVIGSPCSGHGFKFAPLIGRMLADLAAPN
jgi:monomeric sarcosine oxidase